LYTYTTTRVPTANPLNQRAPFARRKTKRGTEIY
jgi:hypothetical protein